MRAEGILAENRGRRRPSPGLSSDDRDPALDWLLIGVLVCVWGFGALRAAALALRGAQVVAVDRQRTLAQGFGDLAAFAGFALLAYEAITFAWPLQRHLVPSSLRTVVLDRLALRALGGLTIVTALLIWLAAMGDAWRIGIDRSAPRSLVTRGIFAWTRNPIYAAFDLLLVGVFLLQGRLIFLVLALFLMPMFHLQVLREERFLERLYGDAYRDYRARIGRYLTV